MHRHRFSDDVITNVTKAEHGDAGATAKCIVAVSELADLNMLKIALRDLLIAQVTHGDPMGRRELDSALAGLTILISPSLIHHCHNERSLR